MNNDLGYTLEATLFHPDHISNSATLGSASLLISPLGLRLERVVIACMPQGFRVIFPRRAVIHGQHLLIKNGEPVTPRPAYFVTLEAWERFSNAALAAIEEKFPGQLLAAANTKVLTPRAAVAA
jgi:hypothetical protein